MAHTYIPKFKYLNFEGERYTLGFFAYVAGGFGKNIQNNFEKLLLDTGGVPGSYITAYNFTQLLRLHRARSFSSIEFVKLFSSNKEIVYDQI